METLSLCSPNTNLESKTPECRPHPSRFVPPADSPAPFLECQQKTIWFLSLSSVKPSKGGGEIITVPACDDIIGSCPRKQKSLQDAEETSPTYDVTEKTVVEIKKRREGGVWKDKNKHLYIGTNNNTCSAFDF